MSQQLATVHVSEMENLKPESVAFISYAINNMARVPYDQLVFCPVDEKFAKVKARYAMALSCDVPGRYMEFWMIYSGENRDEPGALVVRVTNDGVVEEESIGFFQMVIRPYHMEECLKAINALPPAFETMKSYAQKH